MEFHNTLAKISQDKEMTLEATRVWMQLVSKMDFENFIHIPQKDIAATLQMQRSQVCRAMKKLVSKGLIEPGPAYSYRLNWSKYD